jgi:hypothetical protein
MTDTIIGPRLKNGDPQGRKVHRMLDQGAAAWRCLRWSRHCWWLIPVFLAACQSSYQMGWN